MKLDWRSAVALLFLCILCFIQFAYWIDPITLSDIVAIRDSLISYIQQFPVAAIFIYIGFYTISIIFGIPISSTLIGGYFFGVFWGVVYTFIAFILGSIVLCVLARYILRDYIKERYKKELQLFNKFLKKYGFLYLVIIHALPFVPSFLPHIAAGLSSLPLYSIIVANVIGALPLTIIYSAAGSYLHSLSSLRFLMIYLSVFGVIFISLWIGLTAFRYWYVKKD